MELLNSLDACFIDAEDQDGTLRLQLRSSAG